MASGNIGLHSAQTYFISSKRKHAHVIRSYEQWCTKRQRAKQNLIDQIESIKKTTPRSRRSDQLLSRLEYQLASIESEDAEVADPEYLKNSPNAYKCYRPAYVKLTFQNAIAACERATKTAEEAYRTILKLREDSDELPSYMRKEYDPEYLFASPPSSPEVASRAGSSKGPKQSFFQKLSGFLDKLESGPGMTGTFSTKPLEGLNLNNNSKWGFGASTYYPRNAHRGPNSPGAS